MSRCSSRDEAGIKAPTCGLKASTCLHLEILQLSVTTSSSILYLKQREKNSVVGRLYSCWDVNIKMLILYLV